MKGFKGKVLRVNLTKKAITEEYVSPEILLKYVGGRGIGAKLVSDEVPAKTDALSPENKVVIMTGPLTGISPCSGRCSLTFKSPLTGTICSSNTGGHFGVMLRKTGFDGIIIEGASDTPVYLSLINGKAELKDASPVWGMKTPGFFDYVDDVYKGAKAICAGPAGEKLVRFACLINDRGRAAGRGGSGAVFGSKKFKGIVLLGNEKVLPANETAFAAEEKKFLNMLRGHPVTGDGLGRFGTMILVNPVNKHGVLPVNNFQKGFYDKAENISGETMQQYLVDRSSSCAMCPIACGRISNINGTKTHGPEYESAWALTANLGIDSLEFAAKANNLCNDYGIDTISTGGIVGFFMEASQKGLVDEKIGFGDEKSALELIEKIAKKEGLGAELAEGVETFSKKVGGEDFAIHVKGLDLPAYDPRGVKGQALAYVTSNRGADHLGGYMIPHEVLSLPDFLDNRETHDKARKVRDVENVYTILDALTLCKFTSMAVFETYKFEAAIYARMLTTATGMFYDENELKQLGERIWNVERLYNVAAGFTRKDDKLPKRFSEPMPEGPAAGDVADIDKMLSEYYALRGWDKNGVPEEKKLELLGISTGQKWPKSAVSIFAITAEGAVKAAQEKVNESGMWIEASSPLIKSAGINAVEKLRQAFPYKTIIADLKSMDTGYYEVEIGAQAGADIITLSSKAGNHTISDAVGAAKKYGAKIMIDIISAENAVARAKEVEKLGASYLRLLFSDDALLKEISSSVNIPVGSFDVGDAKIIFEKEVVEEKAEIMPHSGKGEGEPWPKLQVALDLRNLKDALSLAEQSSKGGVDWLEAGTPLIKSAGMQTVRELRRAHPDKTIVADLKTLAAGYEEVKLAAEAGADIVGVCGASPDFVIKDAVRAAREFGIKIMADLISIQDHVSRSIELEKMGADYLEFHISVDEQLRSGNAKIPFPLVSKVVENVTIPVGVAGGMRADTAPLAISSGAKLAVVGGSITRAADPEKATEVILEAIGRKVTVS